MDGPRITPTPPVTSYKTLVMVKLDIRKRKRSKLNKAPIARQGQGGRLALQRSKVNDEELTDLLLRNVVLVDENLS